MFYWPGLAWPGVVEREREREVTLTEFCFDCIKPDLWSARKLTPCSLLKLTVSNVPQNKTNQNTNFQDIFSLFQGNLSWLASPCIYFPSAQFLKLWWYIFVLKSIFVLKMHCVKMFLFKRDWFILSKFWDSKWFVWCFFNWNHKENKMCGSGTVVHIYKYF